MELRGVGGVVRAIIVEWRGVSRVEMAMGVGMRA